MKIHEYASQGDVAGVSIEIERGISIDAFDDEGLTPLMIAAASGRATPETLRRLIAFGANVNALAGESRPFDIDENGAATLKEMGIDTALITGGRNPSSVHSVLGHAAKHASFEKIEVLLDAGANVKYVDPCGYSVLVAALHRDFSESKADLHRLVLRLIRAGAPLDVASAYGESAIRVASRRGDFQLVKLLLDCGADASPLGWNDLFFAVAFDELATAMSLAPNRESLADRDTWERTPFLLAVHAGSVKMAYFLLSQGSDPSAKGRCGRTALMFAIDVDDSDMLKWLIGQGADIEESDEFGEYPLLLAAQQGATNCVRALLEAGANVARRDRFQNAISAAATPQIVEMFVERGEELSDVGSEMRRALLGHADAVVTGFPVPKDTEHRHRIVGRSNPERMNNPFWDAMVRSRVSAYVARLDIGQPEPDRNPGWSFYRFGQSITRLSDGRFIEVGGEHEDSYDPDFCIYNDVVVHRGDGTFDIYGYPESVFPPTDNHTATLVGAHIYIIGCLGYVDRRVPGFTPVFRLDIDSFAIEPVSCNGDMPGWIYKHAAKLRDDNEIVVMGGEIQHEDGFRPNEKVYRLDVSKRKWSLA